MSSLFDVGKSAVQSYRQALAVTGQNIANINTEGYKRRTADLEEVAGSQGGITSLANQSGLGVRVADIRRAFDGFLLARTNSSNSNYQKVNVFLDNLQQLENTLLPTKGGLGEQIGRFFSALSDAASAPTDLASRAVAIEVGKSLVASFNGLAQQLDQFQKAAVEQANTGATELSLLAKELAGINAKILSSGQSGQTPNALLDLRDRTISEMSLLTSLTVDYSDLGVAKVSIGSSGTGPILVDGSNYSTAGYVESFGRIQVTIGSGANRRPTSQVDSGSLSGAIDAFSLIDEVKQELDNLAFLVSSEVNSQHSKGFDLDGRAGKPMFSTFGLTAEISPSASDDIRVQIDIVDPLVLPSGTLVARFNKEKGLWAVEGDALPAPIVGKDVLRGPGFTITVTGTPNNADFFELKRAVSAAANIQFLLSKPQEIAASSLLTVEASLKNTSEASLEANAVAQPKTEDLMDVSRTLKNSLSPLEATNFLANGLAGVISAGTPNAKIASFAKQSLAKFQLQSLVLSKAQQLTFQRVDSSNDGPHTFDISYGTAYPNATSEGMWLDSSEIADLLNAGVLRSNAGLSISDLGIHASGKGGTLTFASSTGNFVSNGGGLAAISAGVARVEAIVSDAVEASDFQIFTREGRHIAGTALTQEEITNLMSAANGFSAEANYRADYLNDEMNAYRDIGLNISQTGGLYRVETGSDGTFAYSAGGTAFVPASNTSEHDLTVAVSNGQTATISVGNGSSAKQVAKDANQAFNSLGVRAEARLVTELYGFGSGKYDFYLESENRMPIRITAEVTSTDVTNLASEINQITSDTGVTAKLTADKKRIILESGAGEDIVFSNLTETSPQFFARIVDEDNVPAITPIATVSSSGLFGNLDLAQTTLTAVNSVGGGRNATFDVTLVNGVASVALNQSGNGYKVGDTMVIKGSALGGVDGVNDLTITVETISAASAVALGSGIGNNRVSSARFSGQLFFSSSESFNIVSPSATKIASRDPNLGGMASIESNLTGDVKTIDFEVNTDIDVSLAGADGSAAVAAAATYHLSIPSATSAVSFSATVSASAVSPLNKTEVNKAILSAIRDQAPLSSLSGNLPAASKQVTTFGFVGDVGVSAANDSVTVKINGVTVPVDLTNIDGNNTSAINADGVTTAIMNAVNSANLGVVASKALVDGTNQVVLTGGTVGQSFSVESFTFTDADAGGGSLSLISTQSAKSFPPDGSTVSLSYEGQNYTLTMQNGEIVVAGGEPGRLTAYYDGNDKLQVFGGGSISGESITVTADTVVAGNKANAVLFGIDDNTTRFASSVVTLADGLPALNLTFDGNSVAVSLANDGAITLNPPAAGLTARWESATNTTGRLIFEYDAASHNLQFEKPANKLGFKVTDHTVSLYEDKIRATANDGLAFRVDAEATSLASSIVEMSNIANEDLLIIFTGSGAKSLGAVFDEPHPNVEPEELKVRVLNESGSLIEIFDGNSGHSIATRSLEHNRATYAGKEFELLGNAAINDEFYVLQNKNGGGDARNLEKILRLQFLDVNGPNSGGFQRVFGTIVAGLGEAVRSGEIALEAAEASRNAAEEAEAEFSGVNLDEEAASLLEFQQAYQASARILSTARELFRSLIEVV
jgi:flagellar hook-associated protein 1 FlgK